MLSRLVSSAARFFRWCAAIDEETLQLIENEATRVGNLGALLLLPAVIAATGATALLYAAHNRPLTCVAGGIALGITIFTIDRFLVASARVSTGGRRLLALSLRLLITVASAATVSLAVVVALFASDATRQIQSVGRVEQERLNAQFTAALDASTQEHRELEDERRRRDGDALAARQLASDEALGTQTRSTTGEMGRGPVFLERERAADAAEKLRDQFQSLYAQRVAQLQQQRETIEEERQKAVAAVADAPRGGILMLVEALAELQDSSTEIKVAVWALFLFMLVLDSIALWAVELSSHAPYDCMVRQSVAARVEREAVERQADQLMRNQRIRLACERRLAEERSSAAMLELRALHETVRCACEELMQLETELRRLQAKGRTTPGRAAAIDGVVASARDQWAAAAHRALALFGEGVPPVKLHPDREGFVESTHAPAANGYDLS